jgi:hypothetical protein
MTSTVTIKAHPAPGKVVQVRVSGITPVDEVSLLRNGETRDFTIFDAITVKAREIPMPQVEGFSGNQPPPPPPQ